MATSVIADVCLKITDNEKFFFFFQNFEKWIILNDKIIHFNLKAMTKVQEIMPCMQVWKDGVEREREKKSSENDERVTRKKWSQFLKEIETDRVVIETSR